MPDILTNIGRVNQPVGGFDNNTIKNNPIIPSDTRIQNVVDPSKIVRPDAKTEMEDNRFAYSAESNYGNFIQNLTDMPKLMELLSKIMILDAQTIITSGLSENFAAQIAGFMEMIQMDPEQLLSYIKEQASDSGKYSGIFFQTLRDVLNGTGNIELRTGILDFLKQYGDMASSDHLLNNILAELDQIIPFMFKADGEQLAALKEQFLLPEQEQQGKDLSAAQGQQGKDLAAMQEQQGKGSPTQEQQGKSLLNALDERIQQNGQLLKEDIIPFFSKYISRTRDLGKIRDIMTLVTLNTARYLNGNKENVMQSFVKLFQFTDFRQRLGDIKDENLEVILNKILSEQDSGGKGKTTEEFINILRTGLKGEGGYEARQIFSNVLNALLLNESVYMPLVHLMLPMNLNGNIMFSEMWIDPDAGNSGSSAESPERDIRILIKFDIENLGFFDVVMNYRDSKVDIMIAYPPKLRSAEKNIRNEIGRIVADNGLSFQSLALEEGHKPISLMAVFPKIIEGRNAVNVRV